MIEIPRLKEKDLEILKENKVILYYEKGFHSGLYNCLKSKEIDVIGCCIEDVTIKDWIRTKINRVNIITEIDLKKNYSGNKSIIFQSVGFDATFIKKVQKISAELNIYCSKLSSGEIMNSFSYQSIINELNNPIKYIVRYILWKYTCVNNSDYLWRKFMRERRENPIIICSPPKTADITLNYTFDCLNTKSSNVNLDRKVNYINLSHKSRFINRQKCKKTFSNFKIIVGIREPISQNLSRLYQDISTGGSLYNWILGDLEGWNRSGNKQILRNYQWLLDENGNNIQRLWESFVERYIYTSDGRKRLSKEPRTVQQFLEEFEENVLDIMLYPFDKTRGYSIIVEEDVEIFVYQLEKLNDLIPELSEWIGVPFDKLEKGNVGTDKWIGESYKQALQEIEITQEYFDRCYNEPYVQHCYSQEDIEKFKARWRPHIKKES